MTATNHALTGALIGAYLPLPIAIPVAFASHFVLDALPHYGIPLNQRNSSRVYKTVVKIDIIVAVSIGVLAAINGRWDMFITGWVAYSPDISWVVNYYKQNRTLNIKTNNKFMTFHRSIQRFEYPWGIFVELLLFVALLPLFLTQL